MDSNLLMNPEKRFESTYKGFESVDEHYDFPENGFESPKMDSNLNDYF